MSPCGEAVLKGAKKCQFPKFECFQFSSSFNAVFCTIGLQSFFFFFFLQICKAEKLYKNGTKDLFAAII